MKLRKVKWNNHPILGDLELNFVNPEKNEPYETIILAGENVTGKTTILETIHSFLNLGSITPFEYIEYQIDEGVYRAMPTEDGFYGNYFTIRNMQTGKDRKIETDRYNNLIRIREDKEDLRHYGCAYSRVRANFSSKQPIRTIGTNAIDGDIYNEEKEIEADGLKQLLVDLQNQDSNDANMVRPLTEEAWKQFDVQSRMYRFSSSFSNFFNGKLTYGGIKFDAENGNYLIYFKKNEIDINIDNLSTGESQIVFRGTYLLRNAGKLNGSIIFIDEPEISLHPLWQQKILSYYKGLFTQNDQQKVQMIVATHSQGVIAEALKDSKTKVMKLVVADDGTIQFADDITPSLIGNELSEEVNYQVFGVISTDYHNALYGYIEAEGWLSDYKMKQGESEDYIEQKRDGTLKPMVKKCLSEKIRHVIHHPENTHNRYSPEEFEKSIKDMRDYISVKKGII